MRLVGQLDACCHLQLGLYVANAVAVRRRTVEPDRFAAVVWVRSRVGKPRSRPRCEGQSLSLRFAQTKSGEGPSRSADRFVTCLVVGLSRIGERKGSRCDPFFIRRYRWAYFVVAAAEALFVGASAFLVACFVCTFFSEATGADALSAEGFAAGAWANDMAATVDSSAVSRIFFTVASSSNEIVLCSDSLRAGCGIRRAW